MSGLVNYDHILPDDLLVVNPFKKRTNPPMVTVQKNSMSRQIYMCLANMIRNLLCPLLKQIVGDRPWGLGGI